MNLAAEHLADLASSGLTEETLAVMQVEAVRPHDIKVQGALSAYRMVYFGIDGSKNCFQRLRLFPVITRADGSKQKYFQVAGSDPHLYLLPLFDWSSVARDPSMPLIIPEGEKKSAKACQEGLFAIGVAGLWNWRQKLDSGERLIIPTLVSFNGTVARCSWCPTRTPGGLAVQRSTCFACQNRAGPRSDLMIGWWPKARAGRPHGRISSEWP
jgi:hypothetical protein